MSLIHQIQNFWLTICKSNLQYRLFQNQEKAFSAMETPMNLEEAHRLDLQLTLENLSIQNQLAAIEEQGKTLGKYLNRVA